MYLPTVIWGEGGGGGGGDLSWGRNRSLSFGDVGIAGLRSGDSVVDKAMEEGGLEHSGCCWVCLLCACRVGCRQLGGHGDRLTWDGGQAQNGPK